MQKSCPICNGPASLGPDNPHRPFCSERCRMIDLARWFDGDYTIPGPPVDPHVNETDDTQ